jgi:serine/threonine protein kinase
MDFIKKLIKPDQKKRMTADEALSHPWIADKRKIHSPSAKVLEALN